MCYGAVLLIHICVHAHTHTRAYTQTYTHSLSYTKILDFKKKPHLILIQSLMSYVTLASHINSLSQ